MRVLAYLVAASAVVLAACGGPAGNAVSVVASIPASTAGGPTSTGGVTESTTTTAVAATTAASTTVATSTTEAPTTSPPATTAPSPNPSLFSAELGGPCAPSQMAPGCELTMTFRLGSGTQRVWLGWYEPDMTSTAPSSSAVLWDGAFYPATPGTTCSGDPLLSVPMLGNYAPQQTITRTFMVYPPMVCRMGEPVCFVLWVQQADDSWRSSRAACSAAVPSIGH